MNNSRKLLLVDHTEFMRLYDAGVTKERLCAALGLNKKAFARIRFDLSLAPRRVTEATPAAKERDCDISEEELRHRTAQVQARWTDEVFAMRSHGQFRSVPFNGEYYARMMAAKRR